MGELDLIAKDCERAWSRVAEIEAECLRYRNALSGIPDPEAFVELAREALAESADHGCDRKIQTGSCCSSADFKERRACLPCRAAAYEEKRRE